MRFEDDFDRDLSELFKAAGPIEPPADFVERTVLAARAAQLPEGRRALSYRPHVAWWIAASILAATGGVLVLAGAPLVATSLALAVRGGLHTAFWLSRSVELWVSVSRVSSAVGLAMARAMVTAEGLSVLLVTSLVSALALAALHRLLSFEGEKSQWQEL